MDAEVITVGTELLLGHILDTNTAEIARALAPVGVRVLRHVTVADAADAVSGAIRESLSRTGFAVVSGGLGPTRDDVTKGAAARVYGVRVEVDQVLLRRLEERWKSLGRPGAMPEANRTQAEVPVGATVLPNPQGTAPGLWLEGDRGVTILLPGPPHELSGVLYEQVIPRLRERWGDRPALITRTVRTTGIAESALADMLGPLEESLAPAELAYLPSFDGVDLRLTVWDGDAAGMVVLDHAVAVIRHAVGPDCYEEGATSLAEVIVRGLAAAGKTLAVAESCTGGLVGARITSIPGASSVFAGGVIAYANEVKIRQLGVPETIIRSHGAVSEPAALALARGVRERLSSDVGLAVTGIAGPEGGTADKPVGTLHLAVNAAHDERHKTLRLPGDRTEIRHRAAQAALDLVRRFMSL